MKIIKLLLLFYNQLICNHTYLKKGLGDHHNYGGGQEYRCPTCKKQKYTSYRV